MAVINDLVNQIEDKVLRERIAAEVDRLTKQKKFGLVFEEHLPECTPLYDVPVKRGSTVARRNGATSRGRRAVQLDSCRRGIDPGTGQGAADRVGGIQANLERHAGDHAGCRRPGDDRQVA